MLLSQHKPLTKNRLFQNRVLREWNEVNVFLQTLRCLLGRMRFRLKYNLETLLIQIHGGVIQNFALLNRYQL